MNDLFPEALKYSLHVSCLHFSSLLGMPFALNTKFPHRMNNDAAQAKWHDSMMQFHGAQHAATSAEGIFVNVVAKNTLGVLARQAAHGIVPGGLIEIKKSRKA
ncbi:hypothetical protein Q8A64_06050 [Oxalobacteraceae bacterium R-40]|uniref:Uncharacterized protein n=1 Tax=Keguizhuia sedimenti TaxID=3064264 RepID=A0ABU1BPM6_9BURK|nr:hypothetical protein [Oxalobacteraceae bacterium R-40]